MHPFVNDGAKPAVHSGWRSIEKSKKDNLRDIVGISISIHIPGYLSQHQRTVRRRGGFDETAAIRVNTIE